MHHMCETWSQHTWWLCLRPGFGPLKTRVLQWLGVFIAPTTKVAVGEGCCRRAHRTVRCTIGHCPVRQPRHPTVGVRPLELLTTGPPDSPVVHWTCTVHCPVRHLTPALTLRAQARTVHYSCSCCRRPLAQVVVAPLGTPDSLVLHCTVRWIIAEWLPEFPKVASSELISLVHQTLSGGTRDSPVRQTRAAFGCLLLFLFEPFLGLFIGLCWTFGTCRTYNIEQTS
jgi:hypothetical protein